MSTASAGLINVGTLSVTGTQSGAVQTTNLTATNVTATNVNSLTLATSNLSLTGDLTVSGAFNPLRAVFDYGVASGDPLNDRVILWTHAKIPNVDKDVSLTWAVSDSSNFTSVVSSGSLTANKSSDYTAKVDAPGLTIGTTYYYQFTDSTGAKSPIGTTRTLPVNDTGNVKLALMSCSHYSCGYFNAYRSVVNSDVQYALHVGDYIYEYSSGGYGDNSTKNDRQPEPSDHNTFSLKDYRTRFAQYRSDPDLQALHAKMPWITIWDDHEFANNAYKDGAQNHNNTLPVNNSYYDNAFTLENSWNVRKNYAARAYREWMPIRVTVDTNVNASTKVIPYDIYRRFDFGKLFTLHMIDTRIEGRDRQYAYYGSIDSDTSGNVVDSCGNPAYQYVDYLTGIKGIDATRNMISKTQYDWLVEGIRDSSATWQLIGNQNPAVRFATPKNVSNIGDSGFLKVGAAGFAAAAVFDMLAYATPAPNRSPAQKLLTDASLNPYLPLNLDTWDGYPLQRDRLLRDVNALGKKMTFLSGDIHNAFFSRVKTLDGTIQVGYEITTPSITAPGYESQGAGGLAPLLDGTILGLYGYIPGAINYGNGLGLTPDVDYANLTLRGWTKVNVTSSNIKAQHIYINNISSPVYTEQTGPLMTLDSSYNRTFTPPFGNPV